MRSDLVRCNAAMMRGRKCWRTQGHKFSHQAKDSILAATKRRALREHRPRCGEWMRNNRERCNRFEGHGYAHRSAASMADEAFHKLVR